MPTLAEIRLEHENAYNAILRHCKIGKVRRKVSFFEVEPGILWVSAWPFVATGAYASDAAST